MNIVDVMLRMQRNAYEKSTIRKVAKLSRRSIDLVASRLEAYKDTLLAQFKEYVNAMPNETTREPLGIQIDLSKTKPYLETVDSTSLLRMILEEIRVSLSEGIELDSISEEDPLNIVMIRQARQDSKTVLRISKQAENKRAIDHCVVA